MAAAKALCHPTSSLRDSFVLGDHERMTLNSNSLEMPQAWSGLSAKKSFSRSCARNCSGLPGQDSRRRAGRRRRNAVTTNVATIETVDVPAELLTPEGRRKFSDERFPKSFQVTQIESAGQPEWNTAQIVSSVDVASGVRCITINAEVGREMVPIERGYTQPGQQVPIKFGDGTEEIAMPSSAPPPPLTNRSVLVKLRGDIPAGSTKLAQYTVSVRVDIDLHVLESESPRLYKAAPGDEVQVGSFDRNGLDLRPILFLARFPTILIFASGKGIAPARAILEATSYQTGSLQLDLRESVRLFYSAPNPSALAYKDKFASWETDVVKVRPGVSSLPDGESWDGFVGSFSQLFDEDDVTYDDTTTGVVIAGEKSAIEEALAVVDEAGIPRKNVIQLEC
eukprot:TRINITY_DN8866_c0_g1_i1.p1 TRINITY_DN8866_c0_g1~~TRINITY_DN8866_c0_g1_i1.p1  ORF type:complete len:395 (+),score=76.70 TRINITY_DN8866_c0_g1_i1:97-1281(+)